MMQASNESVVTSSGISTLEWWTCREVARLLRVDGSTVRRWCETGRLKAAKTPGGVWRIHSSVVEEIRRNGIADAPPAVGRHDPAWDGPDHFDDAEPKPRQKVQSR